MPGLIMTDEDRAREVAAYVRELEQNESRLASMSEDHKDRATVEETIAGVREQLRVRGHSAQAPHKRASQRVVKAEETR